MNAEPQSTPTVGSPSVPLPGKRQKTNEPIERWFTWQDHASKIDHLGRIATLGLSLCYPVNCHLRNDASQLPQTMRRREPDLHEFGARRDIMQPSRHQQKISNRNRAGNQAALWGGILSIVASFGVFGSGVALQQRLEQSSINPIFYVFAVIGLAFGALFLSLWFSTKSLRVFSKTHSFRICPRCNIFRVEQAQTEVVASEWQPYTILRDDGTRGSGWRQHVRGIENWECPNCQSVVSKPNQWTIEKAGNHPEMRDSGSAGGGTSFG